MKSTAVVLVLALVTSACGCSGSGNITPRTGTWQFSEGAVQSESCNLNPTPSEGDGLVVLQIYGDTFTINPQDAYGPFFCELQGQAFACPSRLRSQIDLSQQSGGLLEGTISVSISVTGLFSSYTAMVGSENVVLTCMGSGCADVQSQYGMTFPCSLVRSFTAAVQ